MDAIEFLKEVKRIFIEKINLDRVDAAIAEIKRLRELTEWRDIATAPKDDEEYVIVLQVEYQYIVCWDYETNKKGALEKWCVRDSWDEDYGMYAVVIPSPTHWLPLPPPPTATKDNDDD